jgi:hypothetical protein
MTLLEPGVFWTDVLLGALMFGLGLDLRRSGNPWHRLFFVLAAATWFGAAYHGFVNTTESWLGEALWTPTIVLLALTTALIVDEITSRDRRVRMALAIAMAVYVVIAIFVSENFVWPLVLQALAVLAMGVRYRNQFPHPGWLYLAFLAVDAAAVIVQQAGITLGLPWSHNTLFHLVEMPAIVLLWAFLKRVRP